MFNDCRCAVHEHLWLLPGEPHWHEPESNELCECRQMKFDDVPPKGEYWVCFLQAKSPAGPGSRTKRA